MPLAPPVIKAALSLSLIELTSFQQVPKVN
jgi:hypothetical protein